MSEPDWSTILKDAKQEPFPGGGDAAPQPNEVRIAIDKKPYADMIGHAIQDPEVELCGVLVGHLKKDKYGPYLHVIDIIRGEKANQKGAQVTFTHDTWNHIHSEMDKHPDRRILGWYHTHGGFGIFLSEMDTFIHENFFAEPFHTAYVYDPLAGTEGFFFRDGKQYRQATRYWIGGKPRNIFARPEPSSAAPDPAPSGGGGSGGSLQAVGRQLAHIQDAIAAQRESGGNLSLLSFVVGLAVLVVVFQLQSRALLAEAAQAQKDRPLLKIGRDPATGLEYGVHVVPVAPAEASSLLPLYRDRGGQQYMAIDVAPADSAALLLEDVLAKSHAPPPPPPAAPAASPATGSAQPNKLVLGGVLVGVLGAFVAAGVLVKKKAGGVRS